MPKIISVSNQKGGVGKTTLSFHLGIYLASTGRKSLLIDCDPQGNLTRSFIDEMPETGLYEALSGNKFDLIPVMENLSLLAGSIKLSSLERSLIGELDAYTRLRDLLEQESFLVHIFVIIYML